MSKLRETLASLFEETVKRIAVDLWTERFGQIKQLVTDRYGSNRLTDEIREQARGILMEILLSDDTIREKLRAELTKELYKQLGLETKPKEPQ